MMTFIKIISTVVVFLIVSFFIKTIFLIVTGLESWVSTTLSLGAASLVGWYVWKWFSGQSIGATAAILCGSLVLGGIGFIFGFFGPMLIAQDTQRAATLGIFLASPLGLVTGAIAGYMLESRQSRR